MKKSLLPLLLSTNLWAQPVQQGKILFNQISKDGGSTIATLGADGTPQMIRQEKGNMVLDPSWAPDGGIFFVNADRAGRSADLCWMQPDGTGTKVVKQFPQAVPFQPTPSPDGKHLVFYLVESGSSEDLPQLWLADGDGSKAHPIGEKGLCFPAWSPDSSQILAVKGMAEQGEVRAQLVALDLEGKPLRTLYNSADRFLTPAWDDGGIVIAKTSAGSQFSHLYRLEGENLQPLTRGEDGAEMNVFCSGGKLYYNRITKGGISAWTCDIDGQNPKKLVDNGAIHGGASVMWLTTR